jgi:1-deoxy-D-xylulose-5-phosphate reductoisomerase
LKHICILGSTGSIGTSTLSIIERYPERFAVASLAAGSNVDLAFAQCRRWRPLVVSMATERWPASWRRGSRPRASLHRGGSRQRGNGACSHLPRVDFVVSAIVGLAGLEATYAAVAAGKPVGLANKEAMVAAGEILTRLARRGNVPLAAHRLRAQRHPPVHARRIAQEVRRIWLTASGGPFRQLPSGPVSARHGGAGAAPSHLDHGAAGDHRFRHHAQQGPGNHRSLPSLRPGSLRRPGHRTSSIAVHSLVEFVDGSILAQISVTDMRLPILYAMSYPERVPSELTFDMATLGQLSFEPPDFERFPCLRLAYQAAESGGAACIALNAADEVAVGAFLEGTIPFTSIPRTIEAVLEATPPRHPETIQEVLQLDEEARRVAHSVVSGFSPVLR